MQACRYGKWLMMALAGLWLAGCSSISGTRAGSSSQSSLQPTQDAAPDISVPEPDEKTVEAHAHFLMGTMSDLNDKPDEALDELSKAAMLDPGNSELVLELTRRYLQEKQPEKALDLLTKAAAQPGARGELYARLGLVYAELAKDDLAISACETAIKRAPELLDGYQTLFFVQLRRGKPKEALKTLNLALKAQNPNAEFAVGLAELYVALDMQAPSEKNAIQTNALTLLNRVVRQESSNAHMRLRIAEDYQALGETTNAANIYLDLLDTFRDLPAFRADLHDKLARIYLLQHDYLKAMDHLEGIVQDDPANGQAYYLLGTLAEEEKQLPKAADDYERAILLSENREPVYCDLARVQLNLDHPADAIATLDKARKKFVLGFQGEFLSALALERVKDYTNALRHMTAAEIIAKTGDPKELNGEFYFAQGAAYERASQYEDAERCFQKSLQLAPDSAETLNYLGYMWADHGVKLHQARDLIEKAISLEPKNPAYLDSLGWVIYKLSQPQEALGQIQKAIALSPDPDPTLYEHLGDIYFALKQFDKAHEAWKKSLAAEPNEDVRKKLDALGDNPAH